MCNFKIWNKTLVILQRVTEYILQIYGVWLSIENPKSSEHILYNMWYFFLFWTIKLLIPIVCMFSACPIKYLVIRILQLPVGFHYLPKNYATFIEFPVSHVKCRLILTTYVILKHLPDIRFHLYLRTHFKWIKQIYFYGFVPLWIFLAFPYIENWSWLENGVKAWSCGSLGRASLG